MERTLEARWFCEGPVPEATRAWFERLDPELESEREDVYLLPAGAALNVKLRGGNVEVKRREADGRRVRFHERVAAQVEPWVKWSFLLAEPGGEREAGVASNRLWVRVEKRRYQRIFETEEQARLLGAEAAHRAEVRLELTEIRLEGQDWWSLCLEAIGDEGVLYDALDGMARHLFAQGEAPRLEAERSRGYAQWLRESASETQSSP